MANAEIRVDADTRATLMRRATYASVAVATVLIAAKIVAWVLTDSVSVLSSLLDSLLDVAASLVNLVAVRHALEPADDEHRFGHGKAEAVAGLVQSAFIAGSALLLFSEAVHRLWSPVPVENGAVGIGVWILRGAWTIGRDSLDHLMDRELPDDTRTRIVAIARAHPDIKDVHDLRTRANGSSIHVQLHLEMDGALTLLRAHAAADAVEAAIETAFPGADVIVHMDPDNVVERARVPAA